MTLTVRRAVPKDAPQLTDIAHAAKRYWNYPEAWITRWTHELTIRPADLEGEAVHAACLDGEIVGFFKVAAHREGWELDHLWVHPAHMGRGIGRRLFDYAVELVRQRAGRSITIEADWSAAWPF